MFGSDDTREMIRIDHTHKSLVRKDRQGGLAPEDRKAISNEQW